ncbi:MAG TPA: protein kinase [Kofleriaceae bacterium]|nr:protein kinase [Kofleriaceae bacterium]
MSDLHQQRHGSPHAGALLGNYRILEPLNRGGAGSVYRAEHAVLGRPAAVKILRSEQTTNPELVHRFLVEARAATLIRHPGIVEVYDCATTPDGTSYIAMELLEGSSLAQRLGEHGRLPEREAVFIARSVASALKAAHREGIIHRDLKPDSIFIVPDPNGAGELVKVLDFGIAKLMDPQSAFHTQAGALLGTPIYMPPEQARSSSAVDHRADLYSLGCLLYQMLAGRPPFIGSGPAELISMHLSMRPQPPSTLVPIAPALDQIVMRLLEKDPAARFRDAGELTQALDALPGMQPAGAVPSAVGPDGDSRPFAAPTLAGGVPLSIADERRPDQQEPRSSMGLVAGIITVAIVGAVALFVILRGGGDEESKPAATSGSTGSAGSAGSATASEPTPALTPAPPKEKEASQPAPPPQPVPTPAPPKEASPPEPAPKPADRPAQTPKETRPKPTPTGGTRTKPTPTKPGGATGPVTHPDGPITKPDSGPVTTPSSNLRSPGGSPINPGESLSEDKKPAPPKPVEQPPAAPSDKLPDKPSAPHEGTL